MSMMAVLQGIISRATGGGAPSIPASLIVGLDAWWTLDEVSGGRIDSHGSYNLSDNGGTLYATGKQGNAADFEASSSQYLKVDTTDFQADLGSFAFSTWVKMESNSDLGGIIQVGTGSGAATNDALLAVQSDGEISFYMPEGATWRLVEGGILSLATWYHLVIMFNAATDTMSLIVNDGTPTTYNLLDAPNGVSTSLQIGAYLGYRYLDGLVDETARWSRILTSAEITALYAGGDGITYADIPAWTPELLTGLYTWVIPDISTMYEDSTKTTPVTAEDDPVGAWEDQSGLGNDFIQATGTDRPVYKVTHIQGDGTTDKLGHVYSDVDEYMYAIKYVNNNVNSDGNFQIASTTTPSGTPKSLIGQNSTTSVRVYMDGATRWSWTVWPSDEVVVVVRVTKPASNFLIDAWINGVKQTQFDASTSLSGTGGNLGLMVGYNGYSDMDLYEFVLAEGSFNDEDAQLLADYMEFPTVVPTVITDPADITGCELWLDANDRGVTTNQWDDKSGNSNHATSASAGEFPTFADGEATFDGTADHLDLADMSLLTEGEVFIVLKMNNDPGIGSSCGLWEIGTSTQTDYHPFTTGVMFNGFGTSVRKTAVNPAQDLELYHVLNISSTDGRWIMRINGEKVYATTNNTAAFEASPVLGLSNAGVYLGGVVKSMAVYDNVLSAEDRAGVEVYMQELIPFDPRSIASLELWLDASDRGTTTDQWDDKSGNGNHFTSASGEFPTFTAGEAIFSTGDFLTGPTFAALTEGEVFLRVQNDVQSGGAQGTPLDFDLVSAIDHYAYSGNVIYNGFGSTGRKNCGVTTQVLTTYHTLNIFSAASDWEMLIDGVSEFSTVSNTVSFSATPWLGKSSYAWDGRIKAVAFFNAKLSATDRASMLAYMNSL